MLARSRRRRVLARFGIGVAGAAVLGAVLVGGASVIQARLAPEGQWVRNVARRAHGLATRTDSAAAAYSVAQSGESAGGPPQQQSVAERAADHNPVLATATTIIARQPSGATPAAATASPVESTVVPRGAPLLPILTEGRTDLTNGVFAERAGNTVVVHFDTPDTRTRRRDKLEHIVRTTLPMIYGASVDSALARIPSGGLTNGRDPVTELTSRGMWVPLKNGWALAVWPQTRPGQDGPLVVTYKAQVMH